VGVDVEDELRPGQRLLARRGVLGRWHAERAARAMAGSRSELRHRPRRTARKLEHGEGSRHGPGPLQEAPAVYPDAPRRFVDGSPDQFVDGPVACATLGGDELAVGDRPGRERELVVVLVAKSAGEPAAHSHGLERYDRACDGAGRDAGPTSPSSTNERPARPAAGPTCPSGSPSAPFQDESCGTRAGEADPSFGAPWDSGM